MSEGGGLRVGLLRGSSCLWKIIGWSGEHLIVSCYRIAFLHSRIVFGNLPHVQPPPIHHPLSMRTRKFHEPGFVFFCSLCADSSSPQISAILVGYFTWENGSLRKSPQFSAKLSQILRRQMSKSWLRGCQTRLDKRGSSKMRITPPSNALSCIIWFGGF